MVDMLYRPSVWLRVERAPVNEVNFFPLITKDPKRLTSLLPIDTIFSPPPLPSPLVICVNVYGLPYVQGFDCSLHLFQRNLSQKTSSKALKRRLRNVLNVSVI